MDNGDKGRLYESLHNPEEFTLSFELVPSRGGRSRELNRILCLAREIAKDGRIQALSITENAGGNPALSPEVLGLEIKNLGPEVITHFSCKDKNRNQMESQLFAWDRESLHNLLVITGDYPKDGYKGAPKPVFDLGSIHVLNMLSKMNRGESLSENDVVSPGTIQATSFIKGVAISPFKLLESELMMQYFKLHRKIAAGADFAITQVGFDARKFHELILYMRQNSLDIPLIGNVFVPNLKVAELMYQGKIPGCVIPESLYEQINWEGRSPDKGKQERLTRAASLLAVLKGLGYSGAHIGGPGLTFNDLDFILGKSAELSADWESHVFELSFWPDDAFYFFEKDEKTGLNLEQSTRRAGWKPSRHLLYDFSRWVHDLAFEPQGKLFAPMERFCLSMDESRYQGLLANIDHVTKFFLYGCHNCGDCTLEELAFLCPQSGCAKYLFNGPCGGSRDGWCEVYPGKKRCLFVKIYERLMSKVGEKEMKTGFIPPRDWELNKTSSWVNYYRGRDHLGKKRNS